MSSPASPPLPQSRLNIWWQAARPRSLTATYVPVALGGVIGLQEETFNLFHFVLALLGVLFLQIAANLTNEYYDFVKGSDKQKTHGLGMILANQLLTPRQVLIGGILCIVLGSAIGIYFVLATGPLVLAIGIGGVLAVILYTAGPYPLAYIGLGELTVFVFMGPMIVIGTYFVMAEEVIAATIWGSLPVAFLVADILHANNLRDLQADKAEGKYTLAVIFGRRFAQAEYLFLTGGAFLVTGILILAGVVPWTTLAVLLVLPEAVQLMRIALSTEEAAVLHGVLLRTARLHRWFGVLYVGGWAVGLLL